MRVLHTIGLALTLTSPLAMAQLAPEQISVEIMPEPGGNWFISKSGSSARIFNAESGEMMGQLSLSDWTPALTHFQPRREFYAAESYFARGAHGERTDMVTIYDYDNLSPIGEVIIPNHMARIGMRGHLALTNNGRHLIVHNINPGHSVSIVDVQDRLYVYEILTPGCAINMAVGDNGFMQLCGDGTLQLIELDLSGFELNRVRSEAFFSVQDDAVFDRVARTAEGWLLVSHGGTLFEVSVSGSEINVGDGWMIPGIGDEFEAGDNGTEVRWRPGGRSEFVSVHQATGLLYIAMHEGGLDTHHDRGTEIWVVDLNTRRLLQRLEMDEPVGTLIVTQEANAKLIVGSYGELGTLVYHAFTLKLIRSIDAPGAQMFEDF